MMIKLKLLGVSVRADCSQQAARGLENQASRGQKSPQLRTRVELTVLYSGQCTKTSQLYTVHCTAPRRSHIPYTIENNIVYSYIKMFAFYYRYVKANFKHENYYNVESFFRILIPMELQHKNLNLPSTVLQKGQSTILIRPL